MKQQIMSVLKNYAISDNSLDHIATGIIAAINNNKNNDSSSLVIVANRGVHSFDESRFPAGEIFYASDGNIGGSPFNADDLTTDLESIVRRVAAKLKSSHYRTVYIVPSGFPVITQMISAAVIQITVTPPVILQYDRATGDYWPVALEIRQLISDRR